MSTTVHAIVVGGKRHGESIELDSYRWSWRVYEPQDWPAEPVIRDLELRQTTMNGWVYNMLVEAPDHMDYELMADALLTRLNNETGLGRKIES